MRADDNRKGKVFSIRITDEDRAILARACALPELRRWGRERAIGELVRAAALAVSRRVLCMPLAPREPYNVYSDDFERKLGEELDASLRNRSAPAARASSAVVPARRRRPRKRARR